MYSVVFVCLPPHKPQQEKIKRKKKQNLLNSSISHRKSHRDDADFTLFEWNWIIFRHRLCVCVRPMTHYQQKTKHSHTIVSHQFAQTTASNRYGDNTRQHQSRQKNKMKKKYIDTKKTEKTHICILLWVRACVRAFAHWIQMRQAPIK